MIEEAVLLGLCGWRIAHLITQEDGPLDIFERFRKLMGVKEGPVEGFFPVLFTCIYCATVWSSVISFGIWLLEPKVVMVIAAMAVALIANRIAGLNQ